MYEASFVSVVCTVRVENLSMDHKPLSSIHTQPIRAANPK